MASQINASNSGFGGIVSTGDSSGVLQLQTTGTTAVTIDTSQNVGIGTASPTAILQVNSTAAIVRPIVTATTGYTDWVVANTGGNIYFGIDNSAGGVSGTAYGRHIYSDGAYPLDFFTNSTQRMRIDSSGRITMPFQPAFIAGIAATSDASVAAGAFVPFNTTALSSGACNIGSNFNTTTYKFTAPVAGTYLFTYTFYYTNSGSSTLNMQPCINVNSGYASFTSGDAYGVNTITPNSAGGIVAFSWTGLLKLAANDVVGVSNRSGNILRIYQGHCSFSGYLIG